MRDGSYNLAIDASEDCDQLYSDRSYKMKSTTRQDKKASDKNDGNRTKNCRGDARTGVRVTTKARSRDVHAGFVPILEYM